MDINTEGNYSIIYSVSDTEGNVATKELVVQVRPPSHIINGLALDGYLSGSTVAFMPSSITSGNYTRSQQRTLMVASFLNFLKMN